MAFDAGAIEATLTLDRNPFTAGLLAAKRQAEQFARNKIEVPIKAVLDRTSLETVKKQLNTAFKNIQVKIKADLDQSSLARVKKQISSAAGTIKVNLSLDRASVAKLKAQLASLDTTVHVRAILDKNSAASVQNIGKSFDDASGSMGRFEKIAVAVIALLPVLASAFTAAGGLIGALGSAFVIAGAGAGAFALVAIPAFKEVKKAAAEGQAAVDKLPPGLRAAGNAMIGFNKQLDLLKKNTQAVTGAALAAWINAATAGLKTLQPLIEASAKAFENVGQRAKIFFEGAWWKSFVNFLTANVMPVISRLGVMLFDVITIIGNFTMAIWKAGGDEIFAGLLDGISRFAIWTDKLGQNQTFLAFMDAAQRSLPAVGDLLRVIVEFIIKLAVGLEPLGTIIIRVLTGIFEALNKMPPEWLGAIAIAIGAIWAAIALGAGGPVALAIGVLAGLSVLFTDAYTNSQKLRDGINDLIAPIRDWFIPLAIQLGMAWDQYVIPAWDRAVKATRENLIPVFEYLWHMFVDNVLPALSGLAVTFTETLLPAILDFWAAIQPFVAWVLKAFGQDIIYAIQLMVTTFDGGFQAIAGLLNVFTGIFTGDWTKFTNGITEITQGFWTIIAGIFGLSLDELRAKMTAWDNEIDGMWHSFWDGLTSWFKGLWEGISQWWSGFLDILAGNTSQGADKIGQAWRKIANLFRDPINWVINTVINDGIIGAWNQVMGWIGVGGISGRVPNLPAFAMGGPIQGGIPGRDSVPILAQQGEYVLSVPAVQAMGGIDAVDRMHTAARGGATGTRATVTSGLPAYADGGPVGGLSMWSLLGGQVANLFHGLGFGNAPMGGQIGSAISRIPGALVNKVLEAVQKKLEAIVVAIMGPGGGTGSVVANGALQQMIAATAAQFGWGGPQIAAINWIISHESGGNPNAQNPTSTAYGLFQFLNSTWGSVGGSKTSDPAAQILYGLRYIASRYGSPTGAQAFWQSHGWYDNGGWLQPGTTLATNMTGSPEAILTQQQLAALTSPSRSGLSAQDLAALASLINSNSPSGGGDVYNVMLPEKASVRELADTLDFKRRVVSKGRYSR